MMCVIPFSRRMPRYWRDFPRRVRTRLKGDSLIAVGGRVEISYQGVTGNENHPGKAVKIVMIPVE